MHRRRAGATSSLSSPWVLAYMGWRVETSAVASLWSLSQQLLIVPWREMASVFYKHIESS